jgi:monothiol glutaredoxin
MSSPSAPAQPAAAPAAAAQQDITSRIKALLEGTPLVLFMKGTVAQPYCGFSSKVVESLKQLGYPFTGVDILQDQELR